MSHLNIDIWKILRRGLASAQQHGATNEQCRQHNQMFCHAGPPKQLSRQLLLATKIIARVRCLLDLTAEQTRTAKPVASCGSMSRLEAMHQGLPEVVLAQVLHYDRLCVLLTHSTSCRADS